MRLKKYALFAVAAAACWYAATPAAFAQPATQPSEPITPTSPPPLLEEYMQAGKARDFMRDALAWANANRTSPRAAYVLLDAYILARADGGHDAAAISCRDAIIWTYPLSVPGLFMFSTFKDAAELRGALLNILDRSIPNAADAKQLMVVVRAAKMRVGEGFLDDANFVFRVLAMADLADDAQVKTAILEIMPKATRISQRVKDMVSEGYTGDAPFEQRLVKLHAHRNDEEAAFAVRAMLRKATPEQAQLPQVIRVRAERLLEDGFLEIAIPDTGAILREKDLSAAEFERWTVLQAWALIASGKEADAIAQLNQLIKDHPQSPWLSPAKELLMCVDGEKNRAALRDAIIAASHRARENGAQGELRGVIRPEGRAPMTIYVAWVRGERFELRLEAEGKPIFLQRSTRTSADVYTNDTNRTYHLNGPYSLAGTIGMQRMPIGKYKRMTSLNLIANVDGFLEGLRATLSIPEFSQSDAAGMMLLTEHRRGSLVKVTTDDKGNRRFTLIAPRVYAPELWRCEFAFDANGGWQSIAHPSVEVTSITMGAAESFKLNPTTWPETPVEDAGENAGKVMVEVMKALMGVMPQPEVKKP